MSRKLGISMRQRGDLMRQLTEGVADGRGEIRVIVVGGEKRLKFVDVPTEVTEDLPRVRREIEATIDRQNWPVMGENRPGTVRHGTRGGHSLGAK